VTYLLDINVLIALSDPGHVHHDAAHRWFSAIGSASWATCPMTENGFVRVVSNPTYRSISETPSQTTLRLRISCAAPGHVFWPNTLSITDATVFNLSKLQGHQQLTDHYLAGMAYHHDAKLATFDANIPVHTLIGAPQTSSSSFQQVNPSAVRV
jgi:uncharacterized protein